MFVCKGACVYMYACVFIMNDGNLKEEGLETNTAQPSVRETTLKNYITLHIILHSVPYQRNV